MDNRWCTACGCEFTPNARTPKQSYCTEAACQRERKRLWQLLKRRSDPDYLDNQARAQRDWVARNHEYWREYRRSHPAYAERNRQQQRQRRRRSVAKMDASRIRSSLANGLYELRPLDVRGVAKMDPIRVFLSVLDDLPPGGSALQREDLIGGLRRT